MQALDTVRSFPTPEHIAFRHRTAGPLVRSFAWVVDLAVRLGVLLVLLFPVLVVGIKVGMGIWLLLWFLIDWLFGAWCEWRFRGLTPGKRVCGIRVVTQDGQPPAFGTCLLRNVLRFADALPTPLTGIVTMVLSGSFQRLGDLAAGTLVVYDESVGPVRALPRLESEAAKLMPLIPAPVLALLDGEAGRNLNDYVVARQRFHPLRRREIAEPLAAVMRRHGELPADTDSDHLLCALQRLTLAPVEGQAAGPALRAAVHVDSRRGAWQRLEGWLDGRRPRDARPEELSALYRGACADLALADAYHLPPATVSYLHHLVARAHARFYRPARATWSQLHELVMVEVPGRLYGDPSLRIALVAFFGIFLATGLLAAWDPELAGQVLGQDHVDDLREMYADGFQRDADEGVMMGGFYIRNNVGIALSCFASGIFAGVGSLVWLAFNGIVLGLSFGYMFTVEASTREHFFTFVLAHGPFELTGITLAGAAGLRLGLGLLVTRGLPWRDSLQRAAREAVPILGVAAVLVACAAPIEAFVSPSQLPLAVKATVAVITTLMLLGYVVGLGRLAASQRQPGGAP